MNIKTMKTIDHFVGIPVCLLLDFYQLLRSAWRGQKTPQVDSILIMKYFGIGSILLASPMLRAIKSRYPEAHIGFLTFASNREIVERLELVDTIHTLRTDSLHHFGSDLFNALKEIRQKRYTVTIDMEFFAKFSTIVTYLSNSPIRIGYFLRQMWRGNLLTEEVYYNHYRHITEVFAALAAPLDVTVADYSLQRPTITVSEAADAEALLAQEGVQQKDLLIGININVSDLSPERRWSQENFLALAQGLLSELSAKLIFIGSPSEAEYVTSTVAQLLPDNRVVNVAGKTNLAQLLGVLQRCLLFISNDSGPLHLATALDVPTVSFFGPETPMLYGPRGNDALVFYNGIYCSPCLNIFNVKTAPCKGKNICMQGTTADTVLKDMRQHFAYIWEQHARAC